MGEPRRGGGKKLKEKGTQNLSLGLEGIFQDQDWGCGGGAEGVDIRVNGGILGGF